MDNYFRYVALLLLVLITQALNAGTAHAIPAFSREHNTECATCHTIFPELNEYGDAFLKNGFVWNKQKKGEEKVTPEKEVDVKGEGDPDTLRMLAEHAAAKQKSASDEPGAIHSSGKSEPLWLAGLPQTVPLSISGTLNASYNDDLKFDKVDLSTRAVSLLSGGVVKDKIGFYLKYNLYAEGAFDPAVSNTPTNSSPPNANDLEEFYLVWRNALGTPINLKAGRFRPQLSLCEKSNKTGISDMATTSFRVGSSTFSSDSTEDAIEANSILFNRLFLAAGVEDAAEGGIAFEESIGFIDEEGGLKLLDDPEPGRGGDVGGDDRPVDELAEHGQEGGFAATFLGRFDADVGAGIAEVEGIGMQDPESEGFSGPPGEHDEGGQHTDEVIQEESAIDGLRPRVERGEVEDRLRKEGGVLGGV